MYKVSISTNCENVVIDYVCVVCDEVNSKNLHTPNLALLVHNPLNTSVVDIVAGVQHFYR